MTNDFVDSVNRAKRKLIFLCAILFCAGFSCCAGFLYFYPDLLRSVDLPPIIGAVGFGINIILGVMLYYDMKDHVAKQEALAVRIAKEVEKQT